MQHQEAVQNPDVRSGCTVTRTPTSSGLTTASTASACCSLLLLLFAVAIFVSMAFYLSFSVDEVVQYKNGMKFYAPKLKVDEVKVAYFNVSSSSHITAEWIVNFTLTNPNDFLLFYQNVETSVFFKDVKIASVAIKDFCSSGVSNMQASIVADSMSLNETGVGKQLIGEIEGGILNFEVTINANLAKHNKMPLIKVENTQTRQMKFRCEIKYERFVGWSVGTQYPLVMW